MDASGEATFFTVTDIVVTNPVIRPGLSLKSDMFSSEGSATMFATD